jgi:hypothetical protein
MIVAFYAQAPPSERTGWLTHHDFTTPAAA